MKPPSRERAGIAHLDAMLDSRKLPTRAMLVRLIECFDTAPRPFLLKCSGGQDRTSFAAALYLIHRGGWTAMAAARRNSRAFPICIFPRQQQRWLRPFLDFARKMRGGAAIGAMDRANSYTPEKLKAWLDGHGLADSYAAIFTVPTRSPHQW